MSHTPGSAVLVVVLLRFRLLRSEAVVELTAADGGVGAAV